MKIEYFERATLYCGDCREIMPTIQDGSISAIVTDPPYGIAYKTGRRRTMKTPEILQNDIKAPLWSVPLMYKAVQDGGAIYLCTRFDVAPMWQQALLQTGAHLKTPIVWDKGNWTSGDLEGDYGNQCELILFAHKGRHILKNGRPSNLWHVSREPAGEHPTPKPTALMARCIRNSVKKGETVLDPFMGSGSTGVAAIQEQCHFIGIEIEQKYFDIACRRIEAENNQLTFFDTPAAQARLDTQLSLEG